MAALFGIFGVLMITGILWDVFETIVLPRRVTRRIRPTRLFYRFTWRPWRLVASIIKRKKDARLCWAFMGPLSLLALLTFWAFSVIVGFALVHWAIKSHIGSVNHPAAYSLTSTTAELLSSRSVWAMWRRSGEPARALTVAEASIGFRHARPGHRISPGSVSGLFAPRSEYLDA
jgi:hypothetical protein